MDAVDEVPRASGLLKQGNLFIIRYAGNSQAWNGTAELLVLFFKAASDHLRLCGVIIIL